MGVSEAFYVPVGLSLIADYHKGKTRSLAIGIHTTGIYLGQALGGFGATVANNFLANRYKEMPHAGPLSTTTLFLIGYGSGIGMIITGAILFFLPICSLDSGYDNAGLTSA
jgi:MFS family permease